MNIMTETKAIYFWKVCDESYGFMSMFDYKHPFYDDKTKQRFTSMEHYLMYMKALEYNDLKCATLILNAKYSMQAKFISHKINMENHNNSHSNWNEKIYETLINGLRLKFRQNKGIFRKLVDTNDALLYYTLKFDSVLGIGFYANEAITINESQYGQNLLGKALMQIREELKNNIDN